MNAPSRLVVFAIGLVVVFGAAVAAGRVIDPADRGLARHGHAADMHAEPFRLVAEPGASMQFRFRIVDEHGATVTRYDVEQERRLHLIVVDRTLTTFAHLHPTLAADGYWSIRTPAGHVVADFTTDGGRHVLSTEIAVDTTTQNADDRSPPLRQPLAIARTSPHAADETTIAFDTNGTPERYLGAAGHLVIFRTSDLEYLHVHPEGDRLRFATTFPSAGRYVLFLQTQWNGALQTDRFEIEVAA